MAHLFTFQIVNNCSLRRKGCGPTCFPWLSVDCTCHRTLCCCQNTKFMSLFYDRWLTHTHTHFISGAFTKLLKESNSFVLSVWPFFCPSLWNSSAPTKLIFMNFTFFFFVHHKSHFGHGIVQCATDLEHLYRIYSIPTHDKHHWLLLQFIVLHMMDEKGRPKHVEHNCIC